MGLLLGSDDIEKDKVWCLEIVQDLGRLTLALGKCQPCLLIRPAGFALGGAVESPCQRRNAGQSAPQGESECRRGGPKAVAFG